MAGETRPPQPQGLPPQIAQLLASQASANNIPDIYSEGVGIQVGFNSVNLLLNRSLPIHGAVEPTFVLVGIVRMSPHQAKVLQIALTNALKSYEAGFGDIKIPDNVLAKISGVVEK